MIISKIIKIFLNSTKIKRHNVYRSSAKNIIAVIDVVKRDINIHNYSFDELKYFKKIQIKIKDGFWSFQIIKD